MADFLQARNGLTKKQKEDNLVELVDLLMEIGDETPNAHLNEVSMPDRNLGKDWLDAEMRTWFCHLKTARKRCKIKVNGQEEKQVG